MLSMSRLSEKQAQFLNRFYARLSRRQDAALGFVSSPEPRTIGSYARGRQLVAGNLLFSGYLVEAQNADLWAIDVPDALYSDEIHGFAWLDDLAAVGDGPARAVAQRWLLGWVDRYGDGAGPGWSPDLTGRRVIRWINHALMVLRGVETDQSDAFFESLARQTWFLSKRWSAAAPGLPRFEALTGLIYAGFALEGKEALATPAIKALAQECEAQIDDEGGLPTRNPEELLDVFMLLTWAAAALTEAEQDVPPAHISAIARIAPTLRALRHSDGGLARFHGGGRGLEGRLDQALAASEVKERHTGRLPMGYARISGGRTSMIIDATAPPVGHASLNAHASTLSFELTSGRRPLIVNCGSGGSFGAEWRRAGRATPSHSVLCLDGFSSARLGEVPQGGMSEPLVAAPKEVPVEISDLPDGVRFEGAHDGYLAAYGLTHARILELSFDGRGLVGEDILLAINDPEKRRFDKALDSSKLKGIAYAVRFHLHPDVDATVDLGGAAISMALKSGEIWVFRHQSTAHLSLEPSVYLEKGRLKPRATKQIVLSGRAIEYATAVRWSLAKAQETAIGVRDLTVDELELND